MLNLREKTRKFLEEALILNKAFVANSIVDVESPTYQKGREIVQYLYDYHKKKEEKARTELSKALCLVMAGSEEIQREELGFVLYENPTLDNKSNMKFIKKRLGLYGAKCDFLEDYESEEAYTHFMDYFFDSYDDYVSNKTSAGSLKTKKNIILVDDSFFKLSAIRHDLMEVFPEASIYDDKTGKGFELMVTTYANEIAKNPEEWLFVLDMQMPYEDYGRCTRDMGVHLLRRVLHHFRDYGKVDSIIVSSDSVDDLFVKKYYPAYLGSIKYEEGSSMTDLFKELLTTTQE